MRLYATFSKDDPTYKALVAIMCMRGLTDFHVLGALLKIAHEAGPEGAAAREYIEQGGCLFAEIAHLMDLTDHQLLDRLTMWLRTHYDYDEPRSVH
jgi:hypothetical protein